MPVARIFTVHPERTDALSKQLQSQGYSVEVVRPESPAAPADLEIDFEIWPEERALYRAAELAERLQADVCVAPGLDLGRPEPAKQQAYSTQALPIAEQPPLTAPEVGVPAPEPVRQDTAAPARVAGPPTEDVSVPPAVWLAAAGPSQQQPQSISNDAPGREPEQASSVQQSPADVPALVMGNATIAEKAGRALATAWSAAQERGREYKQRLDLRRAEFKAARQQRLLELEKRKAAAQERANELQAARDAASARLQELLRERGGEPAAALPSQAETAGRSATPTQQNGLLTTPQPGFWRATVVSWLGAHSPQIQAILTGVAAVTALFVLGLALASFRPRPALSNSLDHPNVAHPNQGVTVKAGGFTLKPSAPAHTTPRPSPAVRSSQSAPTKRSPAHKAATVTQTNFGDDVTVRHFTQKSSRSSANRNSDVTIRHVGPQKPKPSARTTPQAGLKHISDLDN